MYIKDGIGNSVIQLIGTVVFAWLFLYFFLYFLPFLLIVGGIYFLYVLFRTWLIKKDFKNFMSSLRNEETRETDAKIIDAEYEIIDEKIQK